MWPLRVDSYTETDEHGNEGCSRGIIANSHRPTRRNSTVKLTQLNTTTVVLRRVGRCEFVFNLLLTWNTVKYNNGAELKSMSHRHRTYRPSEASCSIFESNKQNPSAATSRVAEVTRRSFGRSRLSVAFDRQGMTSYYIYIYIFIFIHHKMVEVNTTNK